jgi:hypothetical protein
MTTRILYWNIENFSANKLVASLTTARKGIDYKRRANIDVTARRGLIRRHLTQLQADILVIVEVSTGAVGNGLLIGATGGWNGLSEVLAYLRLSDAAGNWNLVPPIVVGQNGKCEGVGVFYRSTITNALGLQTGNRYFTGPNRFSGGAGGASFNPLAPLPAPLAGDYPNTIAFFGANRNIPGFGLYNAGQPEQRNAARVAFDSVASPGTDVDFGQLRQPFMVTFTESNVGPPETLRRHLTIFGVHSPPKQNEARQYLIDLADANEIAAANAVNETRVIAGDFNVNLLRADGVTRTTAYNPLTNGLGGGGGNYTLMLDVNAAPFVDGVNQGYYTTHLKQKSSAVFWSSAGGGASYYPGYGYFGHSSKATLYSIDNILVRAPIGAPQITIVNPVVGSPFNLYNWGANFMPNTALPSPPQGATAFANSMPAQPLIGPIWPLAQTAGGFAVWMRSTYRGFDYFGHIRSASDHLALVADL